MQVARQLDDAQHFNYGDYCQWPDDQRWELIDGQAYAMTAPSRFHQELLFEIGRQIGNFFLDKPCKVYIAPFDVRLPESNENKADELIETVVQPDLSVICDQNKLDDKGCRGAPDWVIEVLSPSTALTDMNLKLQLYQRHGVQEYWLLHPTEHWGMVYVLNAQGAYDLPATMFALEEKTAVAVFPELEIDWAFVLAL